MSRDELRRSRFAGWLLHQCRLAGYDIDDPDTHKSIMILAALALSNGLDEATTARVAQGLAVTPQELTDAYIHEMRQCVLEEILDHPDLARLDMRLDAIARAD
ncbi:hypothetical protein ACVB8X_07000 [Streptomyces sp. NRAIS4]